MKRQKLNTWAAKVYATLLRLYPKAFRETYGEPMLQAFRDQCRDAARNGGLGRLWLAALVDLLKNACAERLEQMMTRRWWLRALGLAGATIMYMATWLGMIITLVIVTYVMLIPWDEGRVPVDTFAGMVNCFFESNFILLPLFIATGCEIIAISRLTRRRIHSFAKIYLHFAGVNIAVSTVSLAAAQLSHIVIGRLFPTPPVFEPGYGFNVDVGYGTAVVYTGLILIGAVMAYFVRLAWRTRDTLPLERRQRA